jgi:hypothetical protein
LRIQDIQNEMHKMFGLLTSNYEFDFIEDMHNNFERMAFAEQIIEAELRNVS